MLFEESGSASRQPLLRRGRGGVQPACTLVVVLVLSTVCLTASPSGAGQEGGQIAEPRLNQPGKDVQWVPTPTALVEKMLDLARLTPKDRLVDLGSGDGVLVIAAARRG